MCRLIRCYMQQWLGGGVSAKKELNLCCNVPKKKGPSVVDSPISVHGVERDYSLFFMRRSLIRAFLPVRSRK